MQFLHEIRRPGEFFLFVREVHILGHDPHALRTGPREEAIDESILTVTVSVAGMTFLTDAEAGAADGPTPGTPGAGRRIEPGRPTGF
jgi:hypothetical protein